MKTSIKLEQGLKAEAHRIKKNLERNSNEPENTLDQVSAVTKQQENMDTHTHKDNLKETARKGAEEARSQNQIDDIIRGHGQECKNKDESEITVFFKTSLYIFIYTNRLL